MYCFYSCKGQESGQEICTGFFVVNIEHTWVSCEIFLPTQKWRTMNINWVPDYWYSLPWINSCVQHGSPSCHESDPCWGWLVRSGLRDYIDCHEITENTLSLDVFQLLHAWVELVQMTQSWQHAPKTATCTCGDIDRKTYNYAWWLLMKS